MFFIRRIIAKIRHYRYTRYIMHGNRKSRKADKLYYKKEKEDHGF